MSSKNLGRGIEALISSDVENKVKEKNDPGVSYIKISDVRPNPNQPRRNFDSKALIELSNSISEKGIITPITIIIGSYFCTVYYVFCEMCCKEKFIFSFLIHFTIW